ncbi:hypothetical protein RI129_007676, partial [Pyrocoelia pectoralis]
SVKVKRFFTNSIVEDEDEFYVTQSSEVASTPSKLGLEIESGEANNTKRQKGIMLILFHYRSRQERVLETIATRSYFVKSTIQHHKAERLETFDKLLRMRRTKCFQCCPTRRPLFFL